MVESTQVSDAVVATDAEAFAAFAADLKVFRPDLADELLAHKIEIQDFSLVVLVGATGSGKSTFAAGHFSQENVLSSDAMRKLVRNTEFDRSKQASQDAFDVLDHVLDLRLAAGLFTVVDATSISWESRKPIMDLARKHNCKATAVVFALDVATCAKRNASRQGKDASQVMKHTKILWKDLGGKDGKRLYREGFSDVHVFTSEDEVSRVRFERTRMPSDFRSRSGGFDIISDVQGCADELKELLAKLGYVNAGSIWSHPEARTVVFCGNVIGLGPQSYEVLRLVLDMHASSCALYCTGWVEARLFGTLLGKDNVPADVVAGFCATLAELDTDGQQRGIWLSFLRQQPHHLVLDGGKLVVASGGLPEHMHNRDSWAIRRSTQGDNSMSHMKHLSRERVPDWANEYAGHATVVYGNGAVLEPKWVHRTIGIDTGVHLGHKLTALRWPSCELVSVDAKQEYVVPERDAPVVVEQNPRDEALVLPDVEHGIEIDTRLLARVKIPPEDLISAVEVVSRQGVHPKWLIYLPPTMSPCETCNEPDLLEHPKDAFAYYRKHKVQTVVCEEKHMGSRAVVIVGKDPDTMFRHFGVQEPGIVYTRTGRRFFHDRERELSVLTKVWAAVQASGVFGDIDWICLDCEILPWSVKSRDSLRTQYAATGWAGKAALGAADKLLAEAKEGRPELDVLAARTRQRLDEVVQYDDAWRRYCWNVEDEADLKVAPFHVLAVSGEAFTNRTNEWHMQTCRHIVGADTSGVLHTTWWYKVDLSDEATMSEICAEWTRRTEAGEEGMVFKPLDFVVQGGRGLVQPAIKVRGRKYLRIIYGPEYLLPEHLKRLRKRSVGGKRALADKEFALSVEGLERFVRGESLARVHECALGVLALEAESVDPRL